MSNQISVYLRSERAMGAVNLLFFLGIWMGGAVLAMGYLIWLAYLLCRLNDASTGGQKALYVTFALFAAVMITVTLLGNAYVMWRDLAWGIRRYILSAGM